MYTTRSTSASIKSHVRNHAPVIGQVTPFVAQSLASFVAYAATLGLAQSAGSLLRISCSSPLGFGTLGGVAGVSAASVAAGEAATVCRMVINDVRGSRWRGGASRGGTWFGKRQNAVESFVDRTKVYGASFAKVVEKRYGAKGRAVGVGDRDSIWRMNPTQLLVDVILGTVAFKLTGGSFRSIMPSDLVKPGALANQSIPAAGMQYATDEKRRELIRMFRRDGCHHCGTTRGAVVGDHMPPNKHVVQKAEAFATQVMERVTRVGAVRRVMLAAGIRPDSLVGTTQRYYPQCVSCSQKQAVAVRNDKSARVFHTVLHKGAGGGTGWWYVGVWVGLNREFQSPMSQL